MSLPQSAMITSSIQEAESMEELPQTQEETEELSDSSNSVESQGFTYHLQSSSLQHSHTSAIRAAILGNSSQTRFLEGPSGDPPFLSEPLKLRSNGFFLGKIQLQEMKKKSPIARSETNLIEALRSESPARKGRFETLRHNLRRHTLQLSESPELSVLALSNHQKKNRMECLKSESLKNNLSTPEGIPPQVIQQYEKMNHKDLVLLAIKQQGDLERQRDKISDLENYLDNLLVRVMETTPRILQNPYKNHVCQR
ncbi:rab11 family-interacting protein 1 [Trichonephila clavipes]|nr:rab11 family-interacting protein 1 [Trichonephila clavipes]